jgi:hypothetical protein
MDSCKSFLETGEEDRSDENELPFMLVADALKIGMTSVAEADRIGEVRRRVTEGCCCPSPDEVNSVAWWEVVSLLPEGGLLPPAFSLVPVRIISNTILEEGVKVMWRVVSLWDRISVVWAP